MKRMSVVQESVMVSLAAMTPIPSKETGDWRARPARFLLGFWGHKYVKFSAGLDSIRDDVTTLARLARNAGAAAFGAVLPAARRVVTPGGTSKNRNAAGGNAAPGGKGRSSPAGRRARAENSRAFRLGAGLRKGS
jgi:hypothetical protein